MRHLSLVSSLGLWERRRRRESPSPFPHELLPQPGAVVLSSAHPTVQEAIPAVLLRPAQARTALPPGRGRRLMLKVPTRTGRALSFRVSLTPTASCTLQRLCSWKSIPVEMWRTWTVCCHTCSAEKATSKVTYRYKLHISAASSHQNKLLPPALHLLQQHAGCR